MSRLIQRIWAGQQRHGHAEERAEQHHGDLGEAAGEGVAQEPADVVVDAPALADGDRHGGQVVVDQHQVGGLPGDLRAAAHRHPDVGPAQRRCVVDPVAGHRHHVPAVLQGGDDVELLRRLGAGEDVRVR